MSEEQRVRPGPLARSPRPLVRGKPFDPPMVPFAVVGIAAWALAGLILLVFFRDWLAETDRSHWLWTCLAGFLLGFPGLAVMVRHDRRRRVNRPSPGSPGPS